MATESRWWHCHRVSWVTLHHRPSSVSSMWLWRRQWRHPPSSRWQWQTPWGSQTLIQERYALFYSRRLQYNLRKHKFKLPAVDFALPNTYTQIWSALRKPCVVAATWFLWLPPYAHPPFEPPAACRCDANLASLNPPKMGSSDGRFGDDDDGGDDRTHITQHPSKSELTPTNNDDDDDDYERKTGGSAMAGIWRCSPRWTRSSREYIFPIFRILSVCWWRCWLAGSLADCSANHRVQEECDAKSRKIYYRLPFGQPTQQQRNNKPRKSWKSWKSFKGHSLVFFFCCCWFLLSRCRDEANQSKLGGFVFIINIFNKIGFLVAFCV